MATDKLTEIAVKRAKPGARPVRMFDGNGMYLEVQPTGAKYWRHKYRFDGKEKLLSLGVYPETGLALARNRRQEARSLLAKGIDPSAARKAQKTARGGAGAESFEAVAREWHATRSPGWSSGHAMRTMTRLEQDAFPWLGGRHINSISAPQLLAVIRRIEARGAIETAHTVAQISGQVFRYGVATGRCERNPAADLRDALKPVLVTHMAAITEPKEVGVLMRAIDDYQGSPVTRAALLLSALSFQRPGNIRAAEWGEVDLDGAMWTCPSDKMKRTLQDKKSGRPHLVPLSRQAVDVLRDLRQLTGHGKYLFPGLLSDERCMSENTINTALRRMGYSAEQMTAHGFRAMARTLLVEKLNANPDVIEAQLAHGKSGPLGSAYDRAEFMEQRRKLMQTWADYLDQLRAGAAVIPIRAKG